MSDKPVTGTPAKLEAIKALTGIHKLLQTGSFKLEDLQVLPSACKFIELLHKQLATEILQDPTCTELDGVESLRAMYSTPEKETHVGN